jgi:hypothetical protein
MDLLKIIQIFITLEDGQTISSELGKALFAFACHEFA